MTLGIEQEKERQEYNREIMLDLLAQVVKIIEMSAYLKQPLNEYFNHPNHICILVTEKVWDDFLDLVISKVALLNSLPVRKDSYITSSISNPDGRFKLEQLGIVCVKMCKNHEYRGYTAVATISNVDDRTSARNCCMVLANRNNPMNIPILNFTIGELD